MNANMDEEELEKLAVEEILKETQRGAERAKEHGAMGWQKCKLPSTNKRFLKNMLVGTLRNLHDTKSNYRDNGLDNDFSRKRRNDWKARRRNSDYDHDYEERSVRNYKHSSRFNNAKSRHSPIRQKDHKKSKREGKSRKDSEKKNKKHKSKKKSSKKHKKKSKA